MPTRRFWRGKRPESDFASEVEAHLDIETARLIAEGQDPAEARAAAHRRFGNVTAVHERYHESRRLVSLERFALDLRYALRILRKSPWFSLTSIVVLALGIGSSLAVFRLLDALFLRPVAVDRPDELLSIESLDREGRTSGLPTTVLDPLRREKVLSGLCAFATPRYTMSIGQSISSVGSLALSHDCFATLGLRTAIGRPFTQAEDDSTASPVALLTDSLWQSAFGGREDVLGSKINVEGTLFTVIGVTDRKFGGLLLGFPPGLVIPLMQMRVGQPPGTRWAYFWANLFARRAPGVSQKRAVARLQQIRRQLLEEGMPPRFSPAQRDDFLARRLSIRSGKTGIDWMFRRRFGSSLIAMLGICVLILAIACMNLVGMQLARRLNRAREIAIRLSLGSTTFRVARLFVLEGLLLVIAGCAVGFFLADVLLSAILSQVGRDYSHLSFEVGLDLSSSLFLCGIVTSVAIVLGTVPALRIGRLAMGGRGVAGGNSSAQKVLLAAQVGLTLTLVTCGGLFSASLKNLYEQNLGFDMRGVTIGTLSPLPGGQAGPVMPYYSEMLRRIHTMPDVDSAAVANFAPFWGGAYTRKQGVADVESDVAGREIQTRTTMATGEIFKALGISIVAGDGFPRDTAQEPVAVVSQSLARTLGGEHFLGRHIRVGTDAFYRRVKVIGIASDALLSLEDPDDAAPPAVYLDFRQRPQTGGWLLVRTSSGTPFPASTMRSEVMSMGREFIERYSTAAMEKDSALMENRFLAWLANVFALVGLALAAIGLFGLLSYHVISRTPEIGIRMALGADAGEIRWLVTRQITGLMAGGIVLGIALALAAGKGMRGLVFGIGASDWRVLALAVVVLALTSLAAAWIPARRAAAIEPVEALRRD